MTANAKLPNQREAAQKLSIGPPVQRENTNKASDNCLLDLQSNEPQFEIFGRCKKKFI